MNKSMQAQLAENISSIDTVKKLTITEAIDEFLHEQVDRIRQQVWNNLVWISTSAICDYGVEPTFDQVQYEAYPIALNPDAFIFDREQRDLLDDVADREEPSSTERRFDDRRGLTAKQYESVLRNAEFVLNNLTILKEFEAQGITSSLSKEDCFKAAINDRRDRLNQWRQADDQRELLRRRKIQEAGRQAAESMSVL